MPDIISTNKNLELIEIVNSPRAERKLNNVDHSTYCFKVSFKNLLNYYSYLNYISGRYRISVDN